MAPQSGTTILESFKRDYLCANGGFAGVDPRQYQCHQYDWQSPTLPPMPSCAQENIGDFRNQHFPNVDFSAVTKMPSCTPNDHYTSKKKKSRRRRVNFIMQEEICEIPGLHDYTEEEIGRLYLSRDEMNENHEECWRLVDLMNSGIEYEDHDQFSKRGLIDLKDDSVDRRKKIRDQTYQIVFGVQHFHKSKSAPMCMDVDEITASLYHKAAAQAREEALEAAWYDAVAVRM